MGVAAGGGSSQRARADAAAPCSPTRALPAPARQGAARAGNAKRKSKAAKKEEKAKKEANREM